MLPRISIWGSVRPSVRPWVGHAFVKYGKIVILIANNDVSCNHIIIQSFHHHEDASLAVWALLLQASYTLRLQFLKGSFLAKCFRNYNVVERHCNNRTFDLFNVFIISHTQCKHICDVSNATLIFSPILNTFDQNRGKKHENFRMCTTCISFRA